MSDGEKRQTASRGGIGFVGLLTIVFVGLKLGQPKGTVGGWSWWWVLSPLWIYALWIVLLILVIIGAKLLERHLDRRDAKREREIKRAALLALIAAQRAAAQKAQPTADVYRVRSRRTDR